MFDIKLKGKKAFIAGIGDDQGYGWAIAKALYMAGCEIYVGTWPPVYKIFTQSLRMGKFDESRKLPDGRMLEFAKVYPLDAAFDKPSDVPSELATNKRYEEFSQYTISDVAQLLKADAGSIDILVHSLANAPDIKKPLLETSRKGYLDAMSASSYSFISLLYHIGPFMPEGGATLSLTYLASERAVPGYGGGMSSAKAALESDTRTLAWEAGRKWGVRVNTISAGALASRAARAIGTVKDNGSEKAMGFIDKMILYAEDAAPLKKPLEAEEVAKSSLYLLSDMASAVTGVTLYVDNGMHAMGVGPELLK